MQAADCRLTSTVSWNCPPGCHLLPLNSGQADAVCERREPLLVLSQNNSWLPVRTRNRLSEGVLDLIHWNACWSDCGQPRCSHLRAEVGGVAEHVEAEE